METRSEKEKETIRQWLIEDGCSPEEIAEFFIDYDEKMNEAKKELEKNLSYEPEYDEYEEFQAYRTDY